MENVENVERVEKPSSIEEIVTKLRELGGTISVEICGCWVWISGDTFSLKRELKALGAFWAPQKKQWYWRGEATRRHYKGRTLDMQEIREKHGSLTVC